MDSHDVTRGRGTGEYTQVLNSIQQPVLVLGIRSDVLYPIHEQQELRDHLGNAEFHIIESDEGHDGFLIEQEQVGRHLRRFLKKIEGENAMALATTLKNSIVELSNLKQQVCDLETALSKFRDEQPPPHSGRTVAKL
jgi:hypothetical protein